MQGKIGGKNRLKVNLNDVIKSELFAAFLQQLKVDSRLGNVRHHGAGHLDEWGKAKALQFH